MNSSLSPIVPLLIIFTASCNLLPGGLGHVDMPYSKEAAKTLEQAPLERASTAAPQTVEEGTVAFRARAEEPQDAAPKTIRGDETLESLSVSEMRSLVLRNNLDLEVALLEPEIARTVVTAEEGRFDALIGSRFAYRRTETPPLNGPIVGFTSENPALDGQVVKLTEVEQLRERLDLGLGIRVPLPTGGQIAVDGLLDDKSIIDPNRFDQYLAATRFSVSQPLLRNAGPDASLAPVRVARVNQRMSEVRTKLAALRVLASAEKAYWGLYAARRFLDVRGEQYRLASEGLEMVRRRASEGLSPRVEIVRAEVGVYQRLETLIVSETDWRLRQRDLKRYLATERFPLRGGVMIDIATEPNLAGLTLDPDALVQNALQSRPELIEIELEILRDGIEVAYRDNQVLPIVNLDFQYGTLARDDSLASAWTSQWSFDNPDLYVGLSFEVPITNQRRRAELDHSLLTRARRLATKKARELAVREEVLDMVDVMDRNWQRIIAARQNVVVAGVNYDAERRQFAEGMRTMREVLEALSDLGEAQIREVKAIVDYQIAQIDLAFATGTLLGYARVGLEPLRLSPSARP